MIGVPPRLTPQPDTLPLLRGGRRDRDEHRRWLARPQADEAPGCHADDGVQRRPDLQRLADRLPPATIAGLPEAVAQHRHRGAGRRRILGGGVVAPGGRRRVEEAEKVRAHYRNLHLPRVGADSDRPADLGEEGHTLERASPVGQVEVAGHLHAASGELPLAIPADQIDAMDQRGIAQQGWRTEEQPVHHREHGGVRADAQGESENHRGAEPRPVPDTPQGVADIMPEGIPAPGTRRSRRGGRCGHGLPSWWKNGPGGAGSDARPASRAAAAPWKTPESPEGLPRTRHDPGRRLATGLYGPSSRLLHQAPVRRRSSGVVNR